MEKAHYTCIQKTVHLGSRKKGCYIITDDILNEISKDLKQITCGNVNLFLMHTSAAITVLESYDPSVMKDLSNSLDRIAPEGNFYLHTDEGPDDAPSHIKCALIGPSITIPVTDGKLNMGTWQGVILCEFRTAMKSRDILVTISGMKEGKLNYFLFK